MLNQLFSHLNHEFELLTRLSEMADRQQEALIRFDTSRLDDISSVQFELSRDLRAAEEHRLGIISNWLGISRKEALKMTLSDVLGHLSADDSKEMVNMKKNLNAIVSKLYNINLLNRVLANRAKNSINEILCHYTNGSNRVCNVTI